MQRLKGKKVLFGALAILLACSGDPTGNEGTPTTISADPDVVFVTQGDSNPVIFSVLDEDGQILQADFEPANVGSGITVAEDPTFLGLSSANQIRRQARFFVRGVDLVATSFDMTALGLTKRVQVTSVPGNLAAVISDTLPALGDTISITAPTGTFFTGTSVLTFAGLRPRVVSQDASTIVFIPRANTDGPAVVSNVGVTSNPALRFSLATPNRVKTDSVTDIGTDVTPTSPTLGQTVKLTLPAGLRVIPESLATLEIADGPAAPLNVVASADSSTITFVPPPNADSFVVVSGVVPQRLAQCCAATQITGIDTLRGYTLQLATTVKVTTPVVASVPSTVNTTTPAGGAAVTLTSTDADFTFLDGAVVVVGADSAFTKSVAGDGSSVTFTPTPGATGTLTVGGVDVAGFSLTLPSTAGAITAGTVVAPIPNTGSTATAPPIAVPASGTSRGFVDAGVFSGADITGDGGQGAQYYQFTITEAGDYTFTTKWPNDADIDAIVCFDAACDVGEVAGDFVSNPEEATLTLDPGTYYFVSVFFDVGASGEVPPWFSLNITH